MSTEEWKPVVGWEDLYEVSSHGGIRSLERRIISSTGADYIRPGRTLKPNLRSNTGYPLTVLHRGGRGVTKTVHRLVAEAFLPNPDNLPVVRHLDDDRSNNRVSNLAWGTAWDNSQDAVRNGRTTLGRRFRTHCPSGHEYTEENSYINPQNRRACRTCQREFQRVAAKRYREMGLPPGDARHGTPSGYDSYICRCEECVTQKRESGYRNLAVRFAKGLPDEDDPRHGTQTGYKQYGCKCDRCRSSNAAYEAERKKRKEIELVKP